MLQYSIITWRQECTHAHPWQQKKAPRKMSRDQAEPSENVFMMGMGRGWCEGVSCGAIIILFLFAYQSILRCAASSTFPCGHCYNISGLLPFIIIHFKYLLI